MNTAAHTHDPRRTTYGDTLPQAHDDAASNEIPASTTSVSASAVDMYHGRVGHSHEKIAETVAGQDAHKRVDPEDFSVLAFSVPFHVLDEHACGQEEEKGFETKEGNEYVDKVGVDARKGAEMLSRDDVGHRWVSECELGNKSRRKLDGPLSGLLGPIARQIMNAIAAISHRNDVSKMIKVRLDCLYNAYTRSCIIATGKNVSYASVYWWKSGPCVAHEYASAPHARN